MSYAQANPEHMQVLRIRTGTELHVYVSDDISDPDSYMNQAYRQAMRALANIVRQSRDFFRSASRGFCPEDMGSEKNGDAYLEERLFSYSSNVIGFSGERGYGKTRTMLSFARILKEKLGNSPVHNRHDYLAGLSVEDRKMLGTARFVVIPPISPSVLEEKQNILHVILTKLYHHAEDLIAKRDHHNSLYGQEERQRKLYQTFQSCYSGINGIKHQPKIENGDLMELQDLGDGLELRRHFYDLVQQILSYYGKQEVYLVLQLDDADSQIKNGFEVMEDVRKYLQLPNLIILMSADMDMMHDVIRQDYQRQFPDRKGDEALQKKLIRICRKYVDKLIPPGYMVYLPSLDQSVHNYASFRLSYVDEEGKPVFPWAEEEEMDLQDMLLMLIYRKTGVVFTRHTGYVHNIIPTTIRGLNHLLHLLSKMEDIPAVESKAENFANPENLAGAILEQVGIQDENLNLFSDYFNDDWVKVKITNPNDRRFQEELANKPGYLSVRYAVDYLFNRYEHSRTIAGRQKYFSQVALDHLIMDLTKEHTGRDDYYLFFAIRTVFTLNHHKMILRQKRKAVKDIMAAKENRPAYFLIDYNPEETGLTNTYPVNEEFMRVSLGKPRQLAGSLKNVTKAQMAVDNAIVAKENAENALLAAQREIHRIGLELEGLESASELARDRFKKARSDTARDGAENRIRSLSDSIQAKEMDLWDKEQAKAQCEKNLRRADEALADANNQFSAATERLAAQVQAIDQYSVDAPEEACVRPVFKVTPELRDIWKGIFKKDELDGNKGHIPIKLYLLDCMLGLDEQDEVCVNFMNFITFLLRLGHPDVIGQAQGDDIDAAQLQRQLYLTQECALTIAANWDVQDMLYKKMTLRGGEQERVDQRKEEESRSAQFQSLYEAIDRVLHTQVNGGRLYAYRQECLAADMEKTRKDGETEWSIDKVFQIFDMTVKIKILPPIDAPKFFKESIFGIEESSSAGDRVSDEPPQADKSKPSFTPEMA